MYSCAGRVISRTRLRYGFSIYLFMDLNVFMDSLLQGYEVESYFPMHRGCSVRLYQVIPNIPDTKTRQSSHSNVTVG